MGAWLTLGYLGLAVTGCLGTFQSEAVNRASREFACPADRIAAVERDDIADNVYDVNACGNLVRYSCISSQHVPTRCTREPDPPRWDLDPALLASLPKPLNTSADVRVPKVCTLDAIRECIPCVEQANAGWRWHPCVGVGPMEVP
jgi:hypothetical protein